MEVARLADMDAERADNRFLPPRIVLRAQPPRATAGGGVDVSFPPCPMPATSDDVSFFPSPSDADDDCDDDIDEG